MIVELHLILQSPPPGIDFALQKGSGNNYEPVQVQRSGTGDLHFNFSVGAKQQKEKDTLPDFKGPFVQGPLAGRFIYIDIGAYAGQQGAWGGRLKIPLTGVTWQQLNELNSNPAAFLQTSVPGTGKNGNPNCATVKPFEGWHTAAL